MAEESSPLPGPSADTPALDKSRSISRKRKLEEVDVTVTSPDVSEPKLKKRKSRHQANGPVDVKAVDNEGASLQTVEEMGEDGNDHQDGATCDMDTGNDVNNQEIDNPQPSVSRKGKSQHKNKSSRSVKPSLARIFSVQYDAEKLARLLNIDNVKLLYEKLEKKRTFMNRVDVVTNEMLDLNPVIDPNVQLDNDVETMRTLFPDCDTVFLRESLSAKPYDLQRVQNLSLELFEDRSYPKLKDREEKERLAALKERVTRDEFNLEDFLQTFPNPDHYFCDLNKRLSDNYKLHAKIQLENMFPFLHTTVIRKALTSRKGHFTLAYRDLESGRYNPKETRHSSRRATPVERPKEELPEKTDEHFYMELMYTRHEKEIRGYFQEKKKAKKRRHKLAKEKGELLSCDCCCNDDILAEDMLPCQEGHLFCAECVLSSTEELIGQAKVKFPCLSGEPGCEYHTKTLENVLSPKMFVVLLRKIQEAEVQAAGIDDLVSCPFCPFASIIPNQHDKVFRCLNPECMKESCRKCQKINHVPLSCEEVKKVRKADMRSYIEIKMSEAMIRVCHKCKNHFYRTEGCNMMRCSCGAKMCYICRKAIDSYSHFGAKRCPQYSDVENMHKDEIIKGAELAKESYVIEHPEAAEVEPDYDPVEAFNKMIEEQAGTT